MGWMTETCIVRLHWTLPIPSGMRKKSWEFVESEANMKICHYDNNRAGVIVADKVHNFGDALIKAGLARQGYTMLEIIDALANNPAAMQIARDVSPGAGGIDLSS